MADKESTDGLGSTMRAQMARDTLRKPTVEGHREHRRLEVRDVESTNGSRDDESTDGSRDDESTNGSTRKQVAPGTPKAQIDGS